ncbi:hypothetical protein HZB01_01595 [Candidatus Woesearchaeota archaeon]|nr:hypothetical protein [Candidatus Woesearchaeota archaeon]
MEISVVVSLVVYVLWVLLVWVVEPRKYAVAEKLTWSVLPLTLSVFLMFLLLAKVSPWVMLLAVVVPLGWYAYPTAGKSRLFVYYHEQLALLRRSFTEKKKLLKVGLIDFGFALALMVCIMVLYFVFFKNIWMMVDVYAQNALLPEAQALAARALMGILLLAISFFLLFSFFKGWVWHALSSTSRYSGKQFLKFMGLTALWAAVFALPMLIILALWGALYQGPLAGVEVLLKLLYAFIFLWVAVLVVMWGIVNASYMALGRYGRIWKAIKEGFRIGIKRVHYYLVPYSFLLLAYMVLFSIPYFLQEYIIVQQVVSGIIAFVFGVWMKVYLSAVIGPLLRR